MEGIQQLPADVLVSVISRAAAGPRDACIAATVSLAFRAAADSDTVWSRFLPADLAPLVYPTPPPRSKKELFLRLSETHALVEDGLMSAWLDRETGAKSYMIAARAMAIIWVDTPDYWRWIVREDSRFSTCAELLAVCWLDISGCMPCRMLSGDTRYAAYLVFKMADDCFGLDSPLQEASVSVGEGGTSTAHWIRLQSYHVGDEENGVTEEGAPPRLPHERPDGWMEVELGDWYNHGGDDDLVVRASVKEARFGGNWKKGLIVQGLEIRPKN
ncbi:ATPP2-B12 [Zea mays]|uniref:ATPP2-B12 n=1 Tax=Zea mays TaxID=4577 RepID=B6TM11_MAIZE|nr:ATPP2-B12 [Zea mays]ACG38144.1 ATPP2-B12 [Zea mays]|eukprot:NP_001150180.1 ATPP2-B12 [Zea mays]